MPTRGRQADTMVLERLNTPPEVQAPTEQVAAVTPKQAA
jgi:hypothetical protein